MKQTYNKPTADEIADLAESGKDISKYFTNKGKMKYPTQRVNVDFTVQMLEELEKGGVYMKMSHPPSRKTRKDRK